MKWSALATLLAAATITAFVSRPAAGAQGPPSGGFGFVEGRIVDVRGNIVQVRPRYSSKTTRVIVDAKTDIQSQQTVPLQKLKPGMVLFGLGDYDDKGGVTPRVMMVVDRRDGFFAQKQRGVRANGYGRSAMFGGKVKSVSPLVLTDDDGQDIAPTLLAASGAVPVLRRGKAGREALLVGRTVFASGKKTADGLIQARSIQVEGAPGTAGGGVLFGTVVSVSPRLIVRPRLGTDTFAVTLAKQSRMLRQVTLDPDTVKVGDTLTVQGRRTAGTAGAPTAVTAFVLVSGARQRYPMVSPSGLNAVFRGGAAANATCVGTVAALSPFVLTLASGGGSVTVTVPGQVPFVEMRPVARADLRPGAKIMLVGSEGKQGGLLATHVVLDASPVVGLGN